MKLYYSSSVCSLAVRIIIHELGISCDYEAVNLKTKQTESGHDYLKINPKGAVPVLQLNDGEILTENVVILQYLADTNHAVELLPAIDNMQRYRVLEWLNFVGTDLHRYCAPLFWSRFTEEVKETIFRPIFYNKLTVIERHLKNNKFLMGNQFTLADSYLLVILVWMAKLKIDMTAWPNLSRYFSDMKQRQSIEQALHEEGLTDL